jgi:hypothetical protein
MTERDPLLDFVETVSGEAHLKVEEDLGEGFVRLRISEAERRQAKHDIRSFEDVIIELLRNSRDAHASRLFVATHREAERRVMTVVDDGTGVPEHLHDKIFEPRVTSKLETMVTDSWGVHGRGMALYSVRSNVVTARVAASENHRGLALHVVSDINDLTERADQSTWPAIERNEEGELVVARGPHNIVRRVIEFALEHPRIDVYLGSPAEIVATMHAVARDELDAADLLFNDDTARLMVWQRPTAAADAAELVRTAASLGLEISERTAHRVLSGELEPLSTVLATATLSAPQQQSSPDIYKDRRGLKIAEEDLTRFSNELTSAFDDLAERYYLHLRGEPRILVGKDEIRVRFSVEKDE